MAKWKFNTHLYESQAIIHATFRAHQSTILQLATRYKVGQETMRQFLIATMDDYREIVIELRNMLYLSNHQAFMGERMLGKPVISSSEKLTRSMKDFTPEEIKEIHRRLEARIMHPQINYHSFVVDSVLENFCDVNQSDR